MVIFAYLAWLTIIFAGDFPDIAKLQEWLAAYNLNEFSELNHRLIDVVDLVLTKYVPLFRSPSRCCVPILYYFKYLPLFSERCVT
tara:strand:- start:478 stop:732 length:255 start_codon:yes stop_codon:yes gene_type:complete